MPLLRLGLKPDSGKYGARLLEELLNGRGGISDQEHPMLNNIQSQLNNKRKLYV